MKPSLLRTLAPGLIATLLWPSCNKEAPAQQSGNQQTPPAKRTTTTAKPARTGIDSTAEFRSRLQTMGVAELHQLWDSIETSKQSRQQRLECHCQIIERLTQMGQFEEAMKIAHRYGEGTYRETLVFSLFSKSPEPLAKMLERLHGEGFSQSDRNVLLRALARNIGGPGGYAKVSELLANKPNLTGAEANAIGSGLASGIDFARMGSNNYFDSEIPGDKLSPAEFQANYAAAEAALKSAMDACPGMKGSLLNAFFIEAEDAAPFQCFKTLLDNYDSMSSIQRDERLGNLALAMFLDDPQEAMASLENLRERGSISPFLHSGAVGWARSDIAALENWFTSSGNTLPKVEADSMADGVAHYLAGDQRPADSWKWVGRIQDPELKRKVEGHVWSREKEMVQEQAENDPRDLITQMIAGTSGHADYWIETAMNEWIAQDENGARKWYDDHASTLTPTQTEAVSLSYARLALKDGDVEMARKWAAQVITPKMKTKIETEIAKASGN